MNKAFLLVLLSALAVPALADEDAAWKALREGGAVALVRHAKTAGEFAGDPPGFRLDDCTTQRNLSEEGRRQAQAVGALLRTRGTAVGKVVSSPWCRCLDTAQLMNVGPVEIEPAFANAFTLHEQLETLRESGRAVIAAWQGPGTLVVVTHGQNIQALTGLGPYEAGIVVVTARSDGSLVEIGRIPAPGD